MRFLKAMAKSYQPAESIATTEPATPSDDRPGSFLSLKVPPPVYLLAGGTLIYLASRRPDRAPRPSWRWLGLPFVALGLALDIHSLLAFKRRQTTPNPLRPEKAKQLVIEGAYRFTRNPMYLGMAMILSGWSLLRASLSGLAVVPAFIWTLNQVQIIPEERQLSQTFGEPYRAYLKRVRRWL